MAVVVEDGEGEDGRVRGDSVRERVGQGGAAEGRRNRIWRGSHMFTRIFRNSKFSTKNINHVSVCPK